MDTLEKLLAIEEIKQVKARRCRCVDDKDWVGYAACHTPDAVSYALGFGEPIRGIEAMVAQLQALVGHRTTVHHVHTPEIEIISPATATGTWAMEDMLWWEEDGRKVWRHGYGRYYETYEKRDGRWLIASRRLVRSRVDQGVEGERDAMAQPA
jgi:hypothetical protein